jgi:hypothetical protein
MTSKAAITAPSAKPAASEPSAAAVRASRRFSREFKESPVASPEDERKKKEEKKARELDKKLLGPGGKEILDSLTPKEIDRKFKQLLSTMGVKDTNAMRDKYTIEQKKQLIEAVITQQQEALETPDSFLKQLQQVTNVSLNVLEKVRLFPYNVPS